MKTAAQTSPSGNRATSFLIGGIVASILVLLAVLPMTWQQQLVFGSVVIAASIVLSRLSTTHRTTHLLMLASMCVTLRYAWFRTESLYHYLHNPWSTPNLVDAAFMILLIAAETYSFTILLLGYLQGIAPLGRKPVALPGEIQEWPTVDIFIPTFNEPLDLVRTTALAASAIDWPADKLRIVILDDGEREEFKAFADEAHIGYVARTVHDHAKAGNINHALAMSDAEYVAIFDCDHVPTRSFLQMTMGWFLRDPRLGMLQTPHHFYSPDPVERNLDHFRTVPNEGELFYGVIQDGNDFWNATFFCGSCAVLRRAALEDVGGIAVETVTEDAHTSLRMQMKGWNTAYLNSVQAAGLATESVSGHVRQRTRWARGMIQVLRTDNPLFAKGLKPAQRLCYLNAMLHFMYAAPRLIFLASPLLYLIFGKLNMPGYWLAILVFAVPHLVLSTVTNSRIQGQKRHTFWNEVYETILSPYILFPTWLALVNPRYGKFNVTMKGSQQEDHFDLRIGWPFLMLLVLNVAGLALAVPRYLYWNVEHRGTVLMNVLWTLFNIVILGVTVAVCYERRQRRSAVRIAARIPLHVTADGMTIRAASENVSCTGMAIMGAGKWSVGQELVLGFDELENSAPVRAHVIGRSGKLARVQFADLNIAEQLSVARIVYSRADRWLDWDKERQNDHLLRSFGRVFVASLRGLRIALTIPFMRKPRSAQNGKGVLAPAGTSAAAILLVCLLLPSHGFASAKARGADAGAKEEVHYSIAGPAHGAGLLLNADSPAHATRLILPSALMIDSGKLSLRYAFAAGSQPEDIVLQVGLNGNVIGSLTPSPAELAAGEAAASIPLPAEILVQASKLSFDLKSADRSSCNKINKNAAVAWVRIEPGSGVDVFGQRLRIADDLSLLPEPFVRKGVGGEKPVAFVFASTSDASTLRAAGIAASWFGVEAQDQSPRFQAFVGKLPAGNAVLLLTGSEAVDGIGADDSASLRMMANPVDPLGKLLVVSAPTSDQLVELVQGFSTHQAPREGSVSRASQFTMPAPRKLDDAPAWVQGNRVELSKLAGSESLRSSASTDALLYMRLAPDLNFGPRNDAYLSLKYASNAGALAPTSNIAVSLNGSKADSVPLQGSVDHAQRTANIPIGELPFLFRNTLTARLYPVGVGNDPCAPIPPDFKGSISGGSYLDLSNAIHLARLPELRLFSNAGFPFTQYADLSQTAILLPRQKTPESIALYLNLLGYFGAQTGYPALRVTVADADQAANYSGKDLLLVGTYGDAANLNEISEHLPARPWVSNETLSFWSRLSLSIQSMLRISDVTPEKVQEDAMRSRGLIEAGESPLHHGRSLVVVLGRQTDDLSAFSAAMLDSMPLDDIHGSTSVWSGDSFQSYALTGANYLVGDAGPLRKMEFWMAFYPWFPALILLGVCGLAGLWLQTWVIRKRHARLHVGSSNKVMEA